jgi:hypothetical protein
MANHVHRQIREALATALTGLTTTGSRVYTNRLHALPEDTSPALRIYLDPDSIDSALVLDLGQQRLGVVVAVPATCW